VKKKEAIKGMERWGAGELNPIAPKLNKNRKTEIGKK
jgi:hypothetical protein